MASPVLSWLSNRSTISLSCVAVMLIGLVYQRAASEEPPAKEKDEGFVSMFNGKDFTGWRFSGGKSESAADAPNWKVEGGGDTLSALAQRAIRQQVDPNRGGMDVKP